MAWASWTGLAKRMDAWLLDQSFGPSGPAPYQTRPLTNEDFDSFDEAANARQPQLSKGQILAKLEGKSNYRMWRLRHDYKWMQKQMSKMGLNPEDARWLL